MTCDECGAELDPSRVVMRHTSNGTRRLAVCVEHVPPVKRRDPALARWFSEQENIAELVVAKRKA